MKVDGGLSIVESPMGGGKSLGEVRAGVEHMLRGGWWVTNIPLYGYGPLSHKADALDVIATKAARMNRRRRDQIRLALEERYRYTEDLEHALRHAVHRSKRRPGHALARLGWDESYADLNAREWAGGRGKTADDREQLFERVPMLRKNGVAAFFLCQHSMMIEVNARRMCNWNIEVVNQRENHRMFGLRMPFLPPLFLAYWYRGRDADRGSAASRKPVKVERYMLGWKANLYDTLGLYGISLADSEQGQTVWLGAPGPGPEQAEPPGPASRVDILSANLHSEKTEKVA